MNEEKRLLFYGIYQVLFKVFIITDRKKET